MADLFIPLRPQSLNAERKLNHRERGEESAAMRTLTAVLAREISRGRYRLTPVLVIASPVQKGVLADTGNHYPSVKAAIDGLVDAGWLPNDTPQYVSGIVMLPPRRPVSGEREGLHIRVEPAEHYGLLTYRPPSGTTGDATTRPAEPVPTRKDHHVPSPLRQ